jgi:surface polysaccharide O-acyltransferase-like enzyme
MNQKGYFFTDAFGDMLFLAIGVLVLVIAMNLFIPFAGMLSNLVTGTTVGATIMVLIWVLPLLLVAVLIWPIIAKISGRPPQF